MQTAPKKKVVESSNFKRPINYNGSLFSGGKLNIERQRIQTKKFNPGQFRTQHKG
jgi:hypothetical protein